MKIDMQCDKTLNPRIKQCTLASLYDCNSGVGDNTHHVPYFVLMFPSLDAPA